ncbi:MAG: DUF4386 domain-containing protein [Chloroflexi bacterium]|nr:DUF4386 domain-containing protein [Chloroflexota bacterium]
MQTTNRTADISLRQAARVAGFGYLIIFLLGPFTNSISRENLIVAGDAATTASNIMASESLFRMGIAGGVILLVADAVVAWALYILLKPVNKSLSLLAAWFRLLFVAFAGIAVLNLFFVLLLLSGADYLTVFETGQLQAQVMMFLGAHEFGINFSFVFFGLHIFLLGYLIFKSGYIPRILGILLIIASVGYQIDSFASFLSSTYADNEALFVVFVAVPAIIAELSLTLWLLIKGGSIQQQDNRAPASA